MIANSVLDSVEEGQHTPLAHAEHWAFRAALLWAHRRMLARVVAISLFVSLGIAFAIPKRYKSSATIMPPDQQNSSALMLAALASHSMNLGSVGGLASGLLGGHSTTALFIDLLRSGTVSGRLIDRFNLQHVYRKRYRIDTAKYLAKCTNITDSKKSGIIIIEVEDTDPVRARDLVQAYLDELNRLVTKTSTSAAHRERIFIEQRLHSVQAELENAQLQLSDYSSRSGTLDIGAQTRAMVDAGARIQAELLVEQSGLESLRQIYGDDNVRVQQAQARIAALKRGLNQMTGSSAPLMPEETNPTGSTSDATKESDGDPYPPLRQLPRLAVPYADIYRRVKVQEAAYELLTQQYELARIEEARDVPAVNVIDPPGIPEKKSFPPRLLLSAFLTALSFVVAAALFLIRDDWSRVNPLDLRKLLAADVLLVLSSRVHAVPWFRRGAQ
jgi:capsule polysaccharide export protein KpsE/RkpR